MLDNFFKAIFEVGAPGGVQVGDFFICIAVSLVAGIILAFAYTVKNLYTKSFVVTLVSLPTIVCVVILVVNGNLGTGVAVAGVFSLIRFRSIPGTAKEIGSIFVAMGAGLVSGMGYVVYALLFTIILSLVTIVLNITKFGDMQKNKLKTMTITIPEDLNYTNVFDDIFTKFTANNELVFVKTTNMGSMYKLTYNIELNSAQCEKEFVDALRCRNGNLEIAISPRHNNVNEL